MENYIKSYENRRLDFSGEKTSKKNYILRIGKTDVAEQFIGISEFHNI